MTAYLKILAAIVFFVSPILSFGQTNSEYNANTFLIQFDTDTSPQEISDLKTSLNAVELGVTPMNGIRLWQVANFPFDYNDENGQIYTVNNIVDVQAISDGKPKVNGTDLNYRLDDSETWSPFDFDYSAYYYTPTPYCGTYSLDTEANIGGVKVGYIDTGLSPDGHEDMFNTYYQEDFNAINPGNDPVDNHGHGTQVSGMMAATFADYGATNAVQIVPLKAMDNTGTANLFHIIYAVEMARTMGVNILNLSFGYQPIEGDASELLELALRDATDSGMLVIASAGNNGMNIRDNKFYPACFSNRMNRMITVGSVKCNTSKSGFSNWNRNTVQIGAPGEDILVPVPGGGWATVDGTSHAAAITTNIAALISTNLVNFNADVVKYVILEGAQSSSYLWHKFSTSAYVDAQSSVDLLYYLYGLQEEDNGGTSLLSMPEQMDERVGVKVNKTKALADAITDVEPIDNGLALSAFPNPFEEIVHLKVEGIQKEQANIKIFNAAGQLVKTLERNLSTTNIQVLELNLSELDASGLYHVQLTSNDTVLNTKIYKK